MALTSLAFSAGGSQASAAPPDSLVIKTMTFNIRCGTANDGENSWEYRRQQAAEVIRRHGPDVIGLQEAFRFQIDDLRNKLPEYSEIGVGRDGDANGEYSAILYRSGRFEVVDSGTFWLSETPDRPSRSWDSACIRICTWAHLKDRLGGLGFYVYNTHLDHRSQLARERGMECIARFAAKRTQLDPFVLMGDFNADESNPVVRSLLGQEGASPLPLRVVDTFRALHPDEKTVRTYHGFKGETEGGKIDYILVPAAASVLAAEILRANKDGRYPSDHYPVTATIRFAYPADGD